MKKCCKCHIEKTELEFYEHKLSKDGLQSNCKDCQKKYQRNKTDIRRKNRYRLNEYRKEYLRVRRNESEKQRRIYEPLYKLRVNLRSRTSSAFKCSYWIKNSGTEELLGATYEVVFNHIESRFTKGMTWENQGEWHIDHIIPLASATTEDELIQLCHYTNLQPLWASDNLAKGDKIIASRIKI